MWDFATAHGDKLGKTCIYGESCPTDPILGIDEHKNGSITAEQEKLKEIYQKLGCKIDGNNFKQTWKQGEIIKSPNKNLVNLLNSCFEDELNKD